MPGWMSGLSCVVSLSRCLVSRVSCRAVSMSIVESSYHLYVSQSSPLQSLQVNCLFEPTPTPTPKHREHQHVPHYYSQCCSTIVNCNPRRSSHRSSSRCRVAIWSYRRSSNRRIVVSSIAWPSHRRRIESIYCVCRSSYSIPLRTEIKRPLEYK